MLAIDVPKLWLPPKPAIIRPARELWKSPVEYRLQEGFMPGITPVIANKRAKSRTFIDTAIDTTNQTTYSFPSCNFSTEAADRYIIAAIAAQNQSRTLSSSSIGGVGASIIDQLEDVSTGALVIANVPTGATGTISVTFSGQHFGCAIAWWVAYGLTSVTPVDHDIVQSTSAGGGTHNGAINGLLTVAGGFVIAGIAGQGNATSQLHAWTGVTERYDEVYDTGRGHSGGDAATTGASLNVSDQQTNGATNGFILFAATF